MTSPLRLLRSSLCGLAAVAALVPVSAFAQQPQYRRMDAAQTTAQAPVAAAGLNVIDLRPTCRMSGHLPAWVNSANDAGTLADATNLPLDFVLSRSPEAQAAFDQMLQDQQTPRSPRFHAWLTPQPMGESSKKAGWVDMSAGSLMPGHGAGAAYLLYS